MLATFFPFVVRNKPRPVLRRCCHGGLRVWVYHCSWSHRRRSVKSKTIKNVGSQSEYMLGKWDSNRRNNDGAEVDFRMAGPDSILVETKSTKSWASISEVDSPTPTPYVVMVSSTRLSVQNAPVVSTACTSPLCSEAVWGSTVVTSPTSGLAITRTYHGVVTKVSRDYVPSPQRSSHLFHADPA